jgi:hypothetical protein
VVGAPGAMVVSCPRFPDSADTTQKNTTARLRSRPAHPPPKLPSRSVCQECTYHVICRDIAPPEGVEQGAPAYLIVKLWITCSALWRRGPLGFHSITNICGAQVECIERTEKRVKNSRVVGGVRTTYPGSAAGMTQPWHHGHPPLHGVCSFI